MYRKQVVYSASLAVLILFIWPIAPVKAFLLPNGGFEIDVSPADGVPDGWDAAYDGVGGYWYWRTGGGSLQWK